MKQHKPSKESGNAPSLAVAAALAMLGVSVGVDVQQLLAASPEGAIGSSQIKVEHEGIKGESKQFKVPSVQDKARGAMQQKLDSTQQKLPAVQMKERGMPGAKPGESTR